MGNTDGKFDMDREFIEALIFNLNGVVTQMAKTHAGRMGKTVRCLSGGSQRIEV
jgi:hypothetical protein